MPIPRKIHYCWFGGNELSQSAKKCISSWKKYFPEFDIIEWNETNYDVNKIFWTRKFYKEKHWSGVSDYARIDILYMHGGIYFDVDVEVIKPYKLEMLNEGFWGVEENGMINSGLGFGCYANFEPLKEMLIFFKRFRLGGFKLYIITELTKIFKKYGFKDENVIQHIARTAIYPSEYFSPKSYITGITTITENTYSIHHLDGSWISKGRHISIKERWAFYQKYGNDKYLVDLYEKMKENNINRMPLKKLYSVVIKRTIRQLFGVNK